METFNYPFHTTHSPIYPKGDSFKMGGGYEFSAAPQIPLQRKFKLTFNAMVYSKNTDGVIDHNVEEENNALSFLYFYERHRSHKKFIYPHPIYGDIVMKFDADTPPELGKALDGGTGATAPFDVLLVEQPL